MTTQYPEYEVANEAWMVEESTTQPIVTFRDLFVWQKSMDLVETVYHLTGQFPSSEQYGLTSQIRRSAVSVPSNIAEGYGRRASGDYRRFLQIALGSLFELQTQIELADRLCFLEDRIAAAIQERTREIERMLSSLIRKLN